MARQSAFSTHSYMPKVSNSDRVAERLRQGQARGFAEVVNETAPHAFIGQRTTTFGLCERKIELAIECYMQSMIDAWPRMISLHWSYQSLTMGIHNNTTPDQPLVIQSGNQWSANNNVMHTKRRFAWLSVLSLFAAARLSRTLSRLNQFFIV